MLVNAVV